MKDNELIDFVDWLIKSEEAPKGSSFEETVSWINELSSTDDGKKILNQLINTYKGTSMFKNGGKLDYIFYLKSGGKCKVTKHQETSTLPGSRARGTADAHRGPVTPDYYGNEDQWTTHNGHPAMNVFDGDDLHQTVITHGQWGTPRRNRRIITNYATPDRSDTSYVDANGKQYPKHPGILGQFGIFSDILGLGKTHSPEYMQAVDGYLQGFEPKYLYEKEIPKHGDGGKNEPKYRDRGTRFSYPKGVERTESQETLKYPEGTMTRRITSQNGQRDTIIEGIDKRYWKEANAEFDKYKNSQKKK